MRVRTSQMDDGERNDILAFAKANPTKTLKDIAYTFGRDVETIRRLFKELRPTTDLARAKLHAATSRMVDRIVEKADVDQLIEVLSRPNIGVLDPPVSSKSGSGGGPGVLINIQAGSLAAVNEPEFIEGQKVVPAALPEGGAKTLQLGASPLAQLYDGSDA